MNATTYLGNKILDHIFGGPDYVRPANLYVGLSTSSPGAAGSVAGEPVIGTNGYARAAITNNSTNFPGASSAEKENATAIQFPLSTGAWATGTSITHFFIADAASGGNVLVHGALVSPQSVTASGTLISVPVGLLDLSVVD